MIGFFNSNHTFSLPAVRVLQSYATTTYLRVWTPTLLPTNSIDITNQISLDSVTTGETALVADGVADDTFNFRSIASNTAITNWYIPTGKIVRTETVKVNGHVEAIFGSGTIRSDLKGKTGWVYGAILVGEVGYTTHPSLIIDGLTFDNVNATLQNTGYACLMFIANNPLVNIQQIEVRQCTFNNTELLGGIKLFGDSANNMGWQDLKIYNNTFNGVGGYFPLEMINTAVIQASCYPRCDIFNNLFNNTRGHGSLSVIIQDARDTNEYFRIYNNEFDTCSNYFLEIVESIGIEIYNNYAHGTSIGIETSFFDGGESWIPVAGGALKGSIVHHNHFETTNITNFAGGAGTEVYENFFAGQVRWGLQNVTVGAIHDLGQIYDNTFVNRIGDFNSICITFLDMTSSTYEAGGFYRNDIYNEQDWTGLAISTATSDVLIYDNFLYLSGNPPECITSAQGTQTNNTCEMSYTGTFPTDKIGAGLSDPLNIGPQ